MNFRLFKPAPFLITAVILVCLSLLQWHKPDFFQRVENATYDLRVRASVRANPPVATNLAFVWFDDDTIRAVQSGELGYNFGLYWPRQVYGRLVAELAAQEVKAIAFDVVFGELRPDHETLPVLMADGGRMGSDEFFALQMRRASNVVLAFTPEVRLPALFVTNAAALGEISTDKDHDGILRRVRAFRDVPRWHPVLLRLEADPENDMDLREARVAPGKLVLRARSGEEKEFLLDAEGRFDLGDFVSGELPAGMAPRAKPYELERRWHMGIVLAARELGLDLNQAEVDLPGGRIVLRGAGGSERVLPVDPSGFFLVDWSMTTRHPSLTCRPMHLLLAQNHDRLRGGSGPEYSDLKGKLVIVGSAVAGGNDLTDRGATPLEADSLLVSKHWNVASSVITGRFVRPFSARGEWLLVLLLGLVAAVVTLRLRVWLAALMMVVLWVGLIGAAFWLHAQNRIWVPVVFASLALFLVHAGLVTWRLVFEQSERRRVRSVFSKIVSPNVVNELLNAERLSLGGARREVTVFFADVRGFTEFTDISQQRMERFVQEHKLTGRAAEDHYAEQARETLATINLYLGLVADAIKRYDGTLDKYIGDCVMAFWGAPTVNPRHALSCVNAALEAQRAIHRLNQQRAVANQQIEESNRIAVAGGREPLPPLPLLELGTGINTGVATVGLMGSDAHIVNFTVFGRDVNLASRLEAVSGRGRIIISHATYAHLLRDDPELAAKCVKLPPVEVKGIRSAVEIYEVPWSDPPR